MKPRKTQRNETEKSRQELRVAHNGLYGEGWKQQRRASGADDVF